jgi:hypothetical protein
MCYNGFVITWRLYIDESGHHSYKEVADLDKRYLGITGVLMMKDKYRAEAKPNLEQLKDSIFRYDPDDPPILVRSLIRGRKKWFYVLQDQLLNTKWEHGLLSYLSSLKGYTYFYTVVIDKQKHVAEYPFQTFDAYVYSLSVLLNRVRGLLQQIRGGEQADVLAESRGATEDSQIQLAYATLLTKGPNKSQFGTAVEYRAAFPNPELMIRKKYQNIAGLQIADILANEQKLLTIKEDGKPLPRPISSFGQQINKAIARMVILPYGRYMLE